MLKLLRQIRHTHFLLLVFFLFGCKDQTETNFLTVETTSVSFSAEQNSRTVTCSSNAAIEVESSHPAWCTAKMLAESKNGGIIEIKVSKNAGAGQERTATVTVSAGNAKPVPIEVKQAAGAAYFNVDAAGTVQQFAQQAGQRQFTVSASVPFTATSSAKDWCTTAINPDATVNNLTISVTGNDRFGARYAEIEVAASGFNSAKINVSQEGTGIMGDKPGMNIKGWVSCNGAGIQGVAVSDGYELVVTDEDGVYYLSSQKKNGYVFISTPGNYFPPVTDNIPQFFKRLKFGVTTVERMDFELTEVDNDKHVVLALADIQLSNRDNELAQLNTCLADINSVIDSYQATGTKTYVLTLGDQTYDSFWRSQNWSLPEYANLQKSFRTCVFNTIGNHDHDPYYAGNWFAEQTYRSVLGPNWYSFNLGKVRYVVLDNVVYNNNGASQAVMGDRSYTNTLESDQIEWLKKYLATITDKSAPLVIAMHSSLYNIPSINNSASFSMTNGQALVDCLSGFSNVLVLTGHRHHNFRHHPFSWLMEHNLGAVSGTWWTTGWTGSAGNHICIDGSVGGYGVYEMNGENLDHYYKSIGYDRNYQFRTFDRNSIHITAAKYAPKADATFAAMAPEYADIYGTPHSGNEVLINVWGYDPAWQIEVTEGSVSLPVTRISATDPLHIISYAFSRLNLNLVPSESYLTRSKNHFFRVTANSPTSTLNIKVTDRFGNVYTETMTRPKELKFDMK